MVSLQLMEEPPVILLSQPSPEVVVWLMVSYPLVDNIRRQP